MKDDRLQDLRALMEGYWVQWDQIYLCCKQLVHQLWEGGAFSEQEIDELENVLVDMEEERFQSLYNRVRLYRYEHGEQSAGWSDPQAIQMAREEMAQEEEMLEEYDIESLNPRPNPYVGRTSVVLPIELSPQDAEMFRKFAEEHKLPLSKIICYAMGDYMSSGYMWHEWDQERFGQVQRAEGEARELFRRAEAGLISFDWLAERYGLSDKPNWGEYHLSCAILDEDDRKRKKDAAGGGK